jgi:hypothetical protein
MQAAPSLLLVGELTARVCWTIRLGRVRIVPAVPEQCVAQRAKGQERRNGTHQQHEVPECRNLMGGRAPGAECRLITNHPKLSEAQRQ